MVLKPCCRALVFMCLEQQLNLFYPPILNLSNSKQDTVHLGGLEDFSVDALKPHQEEKAFQPEKKKISLIKKGDEEIRLNKYIANSGVCSRREADKLIAVV